ncbi:MAG: L-lactate permease [Burkholderiaceae bacterium]|nr:L-lactate permease [Burkholderiaceae bacterium]
MHDFLGRSLVLSGSQMSLRVLTSPAMALLVVAAVIYLKRPVALPHAMLLRRAWASCLGLFAFVALAQVMRQSAMVTAFANTLAGWDGDWLLVLSPLIGMVSGFMTGSNLSGNALMMTVQSTAGDHLGAALLFAAAQNSGAGHAVFTSVPIIVLILTLAKDAAAPESSGANSLVREHHLLAFGLRVAAAIWVVLLLTLWAMRQLAG